MSKKEEILLLSNKIEEKIKKEKINISIEEFLLKTKSISFNNKYALWVIQKYLNNGIQKFEDMGRVENALSYFHRYKHRLEEKDRNIMNIKSLVDLENLVEPFAELDKQKELEKLQKEEIYSETKIVYSGPEGKILIPLTKEASIFWGQGTKWCTAAVKNNLFDGYNQKGPLYILILPEKDELGREIKYQMHFETSQFMNMQDESVKKKECETIDLFKILIEKFSPNDLVDKNGKNLNFIKNLSEDTMLYAIQKNRDNYETVISCRKNTLKYKLMDVFFKNKFLLKAIKANPSIVIKNDFSKKIMFEAIKLDGIMCLSYIRTHVITSKKEFYKVFNTAIEHDPENVKYMFHSLCDYTVLKYDDVKQDLTLKAVKLNPEVIKFIDKKFRTKDICEHAILKNPKLIQYFNTEDRTSLKFELQQKAVKKDPSSIVEFIYATSYDNLRHILNQYPNVLEYAVQKKEHFHFLLRGEVLSTQQILKTIKLFPDYIHCFSQQTDEIKWAAVKGNGIEHVKNPSKEMIKYALELNPSSVRKIKIINNEKREQAYKEFKNETNYSPFVRK